MSLILDDLSHEQQVEEYLKDISTHMRFLVAIIKDAYNSDIEIEDIPTLEESQDGA